MIDRRLMLIHLRERSAYGWAMRNDANAVDNIGAKNAWEQYANEVDALIQEMQSEPDDVADMGIPITGQEQAQSGTQTVKGPLLIIPGWLDIGNWPMPSVEYSPLDAETVLVRYGPNRPWWVEKASKVKPREGGKE